MSNTFTFPGLEPDRIKRLRRGNYPAARVVIPMVPHSLSLRIGQVAMAWALFEGNFNAYLAALVKAGNETDENWRWREFSKRAKLFRSLGRSVFSSTPEIVRVMERICQEATATHARRSTILHGASSWSNDAKTATFTGRRSGKSITEQYSEDDLLDLASRLWMLSGDVDLLLRPDENAFGLAAHGMAALREFADAFKPGEVLTIAPERLPSRVERLE